MKHDHTHNRYSLPEDFDQLPLPQQAFARFFQAIQVHRALMNRKMTAGSITPPGQAVLLRQIAHEEGLTQAELAERVGIARPTVTVMVQKMEQADLIERRPDEQDQRYMRIYLTDSGRRMHEEVHEVLDSVVDETVGAMSESDQREFARLLARFTENAVAALHADLAAATQLNDTNESKTSEGERE